EEAFEFMEFYTQKKDVEKMLNINMNFHDLIYKASHNRMLYRILSSFQLYIKQSRPSKSESSDTYLDEVLQEHSAIFEAFRDEDPDAAAAAVARHLDNAKQRAKSVLWQD
ncbi:MAG: GntR family transcriptional regulator, partial [Bacillota bacterium]|nr:GntR family transcriptional regulator [Bacillota bacterium]